MKELFDKILAGLDLEIDEIDLYGYDIIETSLSMIHKLQAILNDLRIKMQTYVFPTKEDEILFFKTQKPELLGRLLFFYKIYRIETQCPTGSNEIIRLYLNNELGSLTYFFNRNLDFYQYYARLSPRPYSLCRLNLITTRLSKTYCRSTRKTRTIGKPPGRSCKTNGRIPTSAV